MAANPWKESEMRTFNKSTGGLRSDSSAAVTSGSAVFLPRSIAVRKRDATVTVSELIDAYMVEYAGRDTTRSQRLRFWQVRLGALTLTDLIDDDHIHSALEDLSMRRGNYFAGWDADGRPIYKAKRKSLSPGTINRYHAALSAVFTWAIKKRIAPRGWTNPCRDIEHRAENNQVVRYLSGPECQSLLAECKASQWPKLYLLVMLALTTGARRGELRSLRWADINFDRAEATVSRSKNGDPKIFPLVPAVVAELRRFEGSLSQLIFASTRRPDVAYNHVPKWQAALKRARICQFRFHDLRHSCASFLAQSGATLLEIADVLGHRNLTVTRRYSHLTTEHKTALINRVLGKVS
jgi:integrase